jgi:hypothetical protein
VPATSQVALTCRRSAYKEIGLWPHPGRCPAIQVRWLLPPSRRATACSTLHVTYPSWMANENERKPAAPPPLPSLTDEGARVQLARERAREIIELLTELDTRLATKFREWLTVPDLPEYDSDGGDPLPTAAVPPPAKPSAPRRPAKRIPPATAREANQQPTGEQPSWRRVSIELESREGAGRSAEDEAAWRAEATALAAARRALRDEGWLDRETLWERRVITAAWNAVHNFTDKKSVARMHLLESLERMTRQRNHVAMVCALAWLRVREEMSDVDAGLLSDADVQLLSDFFGEPSRKTMAELADRAPEFARSAVLGLTKQELIGLLSHPKSDPKWLDRWCADEAAHIFALEWPEFGRELSHDDWMKALRVWSRRSGQRPDRAADPPDKAAEPQEKWEYLAFLMVKADLGPIAGERLKKAWARWRKGVAGSVPVS